jgi:hypothetical protein
MEEEIGNSEKFCIFLSLLAQEIRLPPRNSGQALPLWASLVLNYAEDVR